ncbi:Glutaredoxin-related protein 5, mitochondrial [Dictyocoela muelleri]|nr:Glutaredoxin-related protein 5, mitochondrial [Dictyocoela muelleri]
MDTKENLNNTFRKLSSYNTIIGYTEENHKLSELCSLIESEKYVLVDLRVSTELKEAFKRFYEVEKFPVMISFGTKIYSPQDTENLKLRDEKMKEIYKEQIQKMVKTAKVFIFIKGTPEKPECKFTRELIEFLGSLNLVGGIDYKYFNIFLNNKIRSLLKEINQWSTFPQIYIDGVFYGGLDVLKKMKDSDILIKLLEYHE